MTTTTSTQVVNSLKKTCARFGTPRQIVSDGGPHFTSREFEVFVKAWGIDHVTSSPNHQQANGKAESAVKLVKAMMEKFVKTDSDKYLVLLELRNTKRQDTNVSPANMMFSRKLLSVERGMLKMRVLCRFRSSVAAEFFFYMEQCSNI